MPEIERIDYKRARATINNLKKCLRIFLECQINLTGEEWEMADRLAQYFAEQRTGRPGKSISELINDVLNL